MVVFNVVARWRRTGWVKGPFFDVLKGRDIIPSGEVFGFLGAVVTSCWDPEATEHSLLATADVARAGDAAFRGILEICVDWELLTAFLLSDWDVTERRGNKDLFGLKSHFKISRVNWKKRMERVYTIAIMTNITSSLLVGGFLVIELI